SPLRGAFRRRGASGRHARGGRRAARADRAARRSRADQGLALGRARARTWGQPMTTGIGSILIAGLASLLICMFLGPKFIEEARQREFGQLIREEGPEGHHAKAGTPTMGGILIFVAVTIPFLILGNSDAVSLSVLGCRLA